MPFEYTYDAERDLIRTRVHGIVEVQDFLTELSNQRAGDNMPVATASIINLLEVERVIASPGLSNVFNIAEETTDIAGYANVALVAKDPSIVSLAQLMSSQSKSKRSPLLFEVFGTIEEAEEWIRVTPKRTADR